TETPVPLCFSFLASASALWWAASFSAAALASAAALSAGLPGLHCDPAQGFFGVVTPVCGCVCCWCCASPGVEGANANAIANADATSTDLLCLTFTIAPMIKEWKQCLTPARLR